MLIISTVLATQPRSVTPWEVRPPAPAPRASESAACSLSPAGAGPTPTPPTPLCPLSLRPRTGTPAPTPTAGAVKMSVNSGRSKDEKKNAAMILRFPIFSLNFLFYSNNSHQN